MKRLEEIKTKTVDEIVIKYEAVDGRVFENEEQCREWEKSYQCAINKMWNDIPKVAIDGYNLFPTGCGEIVYFINVRDIEDIKVINAYLRLCASTNEDLLGLDSIRKEILLVITDSCYEILGEKELVISKIATKIFELSNKLNRENIKSNRTDEN